MLCSVCHLKERRIKSYLILSYLFSLSLSLSLSLRASICGSVRLDDISTCLAILEPNECDFQANWAGSGVIHGSSGTSCVASFSAVNAMARHFILESCLHYIVGKIIGTLNFSW